MIAVIYYICNKMIYYITMQYILPARGLLLVLFCWPVCGDSAQLQEITIWTITPHFSHIRGSNLQEGGRGGHRKGEREGERGEDYIEGGRGMGRWRGEGRK